VGYTGTAPSCSTATTPYQAAPFVVSATVGANCNISATPMEFGTTTLLTKAVIATSSVIATCVTGAPYHILLDAGMSAGATIRDRKLTLVGGTDTIDYQLFADPARAEIWGDGTDPNLYVVTNIGTGAVQTFTVYGEVFPQLAKAAGQYRDTITATITF
jgi:spore coat protein U-like protein